MAVVIGPQNVGLPGYAPPKPVVSHGGRVQPKAKKPYTGNVFAGLGHEGSGLIDAASPAAPAAAPAAPAAPPPDWENLIAHDPEGNLQQTYLDRDNTLTTRALRQAWLQHTQGVQDSYNAHGGLFSGAAANAQKNAGTDYSQQLERQQLTYDRGSHDIHTSVMHRLMLQLTGVDDGMGN